LSVYFRQNHTNCTFNANQSWVVLSPIEQKIKAKIEAVGTPLKDWDINIYRGILTGYNEAFIIDGKKKDELIAADPKSAEIIRPILRGRDIKRYGVPVTGYFSVGCGGSLSNPEGFTVELEADTVLFDAYNKANFDIDTAKYANLLKEDRYEIETNLVNFPSQNEDQYVKVAVTVQPDGLSPDSIYFIPIAVKRVSKYEINEEKSNILFRVALENNYAEQLTDTYYQMRGNTLNDAGEATVSISGTKLVRPLSKNSVRLYAGSQAQTTSSTVEQINRYSIVLTVEDNNQVRITPYGTIEVEQLDGGSYWNTYEEAKVNAADNKVSKYFYLYYRFRTLQTPASDDTPAVRDNWTTVKETLRRLE